MKKRVVLALFTVLCMPLIFAATTFQVETLSKPKTRLSQIPYPKVFGELLKKSTLKDGLTTPSTTEEIKLLANCKGSDSLVFLGMHPFFNGMQKAYADHRPFVFTPDMVWLLISQGFANHVVNNSEALRHYFVSYKGKTTLVVKNDAIDLDNPESPWTSVFPEFVRQIDEVVGQDLVQTLSANFTTTTLNTSIASQITIMDAMKNYFEYIVMSMMCGIPEITLEGTTQDWQSILDKAQKLRKYDLDWWIDPLIPLLTQFIEASKGNVDRGFWQNMYIRPKGLDDRMCVSQSIDGWIVTFFPYDKEGKRNSLKELFSSEDLPEEMVQVEAKHFQITPSGGMGKVTPILFWAGFIGLKQGASDFSLKPEIGWMVSTSDPNANSLKGIEYLNKYASLSLRVSTFPMDLLKLPAIEDLTISFTDSIQIPAAFDKVRVGYLTLIGKIDAVGIDLLMRGLPRTDNLKINGKTYRKREDGLNSFY